MGGGSACEGIRFLSVDDLIHINRRLIELQTPLEQHGILKEHELHSSQQRPANHRYYHQTEDVITLASVLAHGLATSHPFCNANKRTAAAAAITFLALNGYEIHGPDHELVDLMVRLVTKEAEIDALEDWLYYYKSESPADDLNSGDVFDSMKTRWKRFVRKVPFV